MARARGRGSNHVVDNDRGFRALLEAAADLAGGSYAKVGILADDERGGLHVPGADLTVAEIAAVNEYGTKDGRNPARPGHRMAFDRYQEELHALSVKVVEKVVIDRTMSVEQGLGILGATHATNVKKFITSGDQIPPPNAPSTTRRKIAAGQWNVKGNAQRVSGWGIRTLVDTGRTVNAITWAVITPRAARVPFSRVAGKVSG